MTRDRAFRTLAIGLLALAMPAAASCGYALAGRGSSLPEYVRIVGIPQFVNQTSTFDLDRVLTESVRREFGNRGRYRVQPDSSGVDATLTGTITAVRLEATAYTSGGQASRYALIVTAKFEFRGLRDDKILWSNESMQVREEYDVTTGFSGNDPSAFLGQNANAIERLAQTFAKSVVTSILEAF